MFKDLPLLDFVGQGYPFCYHSFINGNRIHRSVTKPILDYLVSSSDKPISFITSSYLARFGFSIDEQYPFQYCNVDKYRQMGRRIYRNELLSIRRYPRTSFRSVDDYKLRLVHGCECPDDGLDRVQDPEGVLGS